MCVFVFEVNGGCVWCVRGKERITMHRRFERRGVLEFVCVWWMGVYVYACVFVCGVVVLYGCFCVCLVV